MWLGFLWKIDAATSIFLRFGEDIVEYFVYESVFGFPPFYFYYLFYEAFHIPDFSTQNLKMR